MKSSYLKCSTKARNTAKYAKLTKAEGERVLQLMREGYGITTIAVKLGRSQVLIDRFLGERDLKKVGVV